ncbi:glutathione S-transferase 3 [Dendrobium catenatum]|uniref:glutathione transferase n=1 Tax=Dendrobium catenatum TaxID=906689 RepID=A0A2I0VJY4_9ASPA|nr:glutathione S-transferase 3 [Dendrobium catenatum]PKU63717.1 Glutathione S-transferase 3 [Dendrobium catenatum]
MAPLKLYGMVGSTNTLRVAVALNELGLDYEFVSVPLTTGAHKKPEYLAINPFGHLPSLEDGDLKLFESRAINKYLANHYKGSGPDLLRSGVKAESAKVEVWLEIESQEFNPPASSIVYNVLIKRLLSGGSPDEDVVKAQEVKLSHVLDIYEKQLAETKYLAGDEFTLADLNHLPYLYGLSKTANAGLLTSRPHVSAWWESISARPSWKKAIAGNPY